MRILKTIVACTLFFGLPILVAYIFGGNITHEYSSFIAVWLEGFSLSLLGLIILLPLIIIVDAIWT